EVARRRATDILFLGRGVSGRLGDRTADVKKLKAARLPVLSTPADIAKAIGLTIPQLRWLAFHTEVATRVHYVHFAVPKRSAGPRGLPQGACTSPGLSNQVARRLDRRLGGLAAKMGLTYTRYADDLTFSGDEGLSERLGYVMARVRHLAAEEGFAVNEKKTRVL